MAIDTPGSAIVVDGIGTFTNSAAPTLTVETQLSRGLIALTKGIKNALILIESHTNTAQQNSRQLERQMGTFSRVYHNRISNLGVTPEVIGVPHVAGSVGAKAAWMEIYVPLSSGSAGGVVWDWDRDPIASATGGYLPNQVFAWYPISPAVNTLYIAADGSSTRADINFYLHGAND